MLRQFAALLAVTITLISATAAAAQAYGEPDAMDVAFFRELQAAVRSGDEEAVGRLARFDLRVEWPDSVERVLGRAAFVRRYPVVFGPATRRAILEQDADSLWTRKQGMEVGNGVVWTRQECAPDDRGCAGPYVRLVSVSEPGGPTFLRRPVPRPPAGGVAEGHWWPERLECPHICGDTSLADSVQWWRSGLEITATRMARGATACRPAFRATRVSGDDFELQNRFEPHELGLSDSAVVVIRTGCGGEGRGLPAELIYEDARHLWVMLGGDVLRLVRRGGGRR